jgi:hypothetical protein
LSFASEVQAVINFQAGQQVPGPTVIPENPSLMTILSGDKSVKNSKQRPQRERFNKTAFCKRNLETASNTDFAAKTVPNFKFTTEIPIAFQTTQNHSGPTATVVAFPLNEL